MSLQKIGLECIKESMIIKHINNQQSELYIHSVGFRILSLLMVLSLVFPTIFITFKISLLVVLVSIIMIKKDKFTYDFETLFITLIFVTIGWLWSLYGLFLDNPGAISVITVMGIYPLLFLIMSFYINFQNIISLRKVLVLITIFIILFQVVFLLSAIQILPQFLYEVIKSINNIEDGFSYSDGFLFFSLPNVSSFIFIIPFFATYLLVSKKIDKIYLFIFISTLLLILLTGRRAFFLSFTVSIFYLLMLSFYLRYYISNSSIKKLTKYSLLMFLVLFILVSLTNINLEIYFEKVYSIFDFNNNESNLERVYQFNALYEGISNSPFFGNGAGAVAGYIRSYDQPWAYELSYVALIFQYGMFGFTLYLFGIIYIFYGLIQICKDSAVSIEIKEFILAFMTGMISFLVANATNPYLMKFDYMWVIFIPVMIINAYKIEKRK